MFNIFDKTNKELNTTAVNNSESKPTKVEDNSLYRELLIKKEVLATYLPIGYFIFIDGHRLVVFDENGTEFLPNHESRLLRQDNKELDNVVVVGKEIHVVESSEDRVTKLLSDSFSKDAMAQLPDNVKNMFSENSIVAIEDNAEIKDYLEEQVSVKRVLDNAFQVKGYNDFLLKDSKNITTVSLSLSENTLKSLTATKTKSNYTMLVMLESIDTGKFQIIQKNFTFSELVVFKGFHLDNTENFRLRVQLVKHESKEYKSTEDIYDMCLVINDLNLVVENEVLKIS